MSAVAALTWIHYLSIQTDFIYNFIVTIVTYLIKFKLAITKML